MRTRFRLPVPLGTAILVIAIATAAGASTHVVTQSGLVFSPADLTIAAGDTVVWQWTTGSHTVTSGQDTNDPQVGALFDAPLNSFNPTLTYVFNDPGLYPYFCRPHLLFGMAGSITVQAVSAVDRTPTAPGAVLLANAPNPFNPRTEVIFALQAESEVSLWVHDVAGHRVRTLLAGATRAAGEHRVAWDAKDDAGNQVAAGVYLSVLEAGTQRAVRTMVLIK